jgi:hypothetical protein
MMRSRDASHYAPLSDIAAGDHSEQKFGLDRAKNLARVYARHFPGGGRGEGRGRALSANVRE